MVAGRDPTLLVIFGAGASYDSCAVHPPPGVARPPGVKVLSSLSSEVEGRPPLADHLFQPAYTRRNPTDVERAQLIISRIQSHSGSIEERLQHYETKAKASPVFRGQIQALRFYLHRTIYSCEAHWRANVAVGGLTNYATLIGAIEEGTPHQEVFLVTFNYDTLLEQTLTRGLGIPLSKSEDYLAHSRYRLIKPHGCLTWSHPVLTPLGHFDSEGSLVARVIEAATSEDLKLGPLLIGRWPFERDGEGNALVPALALPVEPKSQFVCPDEHVRRLVEGLPRVTKVLIVGWKAAEKYFLQLLAEHLSPDVVGLVVAGSTNEATEDIIPALKRAGIPGTFSAATGGFTTSLCSEREIDAFLEA
jgi:hypothetical protein